MSQPRHDLSNAIEDVRAVVEQAMLAARFPIQNIYVTGSRSLRTARSPAETSDWDIVIVLDKAHPPKATRFDARKLGVHADIVYGDHRRRAQTDRAGTEIWPNDEMNFWEGALPNV